MITIQELNDFCQKNDINKRFDNNTKMVFVYDYDTTKYKKYYEKTTMDEFFKIKIGGYFKEKSCFLYEPLKNIINY